MITKKTKWGIALLTGGAMMAGTIALQAAYPSLLKRLDAISSNPNPLIRHFAPTWRSVKKIIDLPLFAVSIFMKNDGLPVYEINLSRTDGIRLLENLPEYPRESRLYEMSKQTIKAEFRHGDYVNNDAKIRYRGKSPEHWSAAKKSWQVSLPDEAPLDGRTSYRFFVPNDKGWVRPLLWSHLAKKFDFLTPDASLVRLSVNKKDHGVYILLEGWEESFLEKRARAPSSIFAERDIPINKEFPARNDLLRPEGIVKWQDRFNEAAQGDSFPQLLYLIELAANASDDLFVREIFTIIDKDQFFRWMAGSFLAGNFRQSNLENLNLFFNSATSKFEPIFFDPGLSLLPDDAIDIASNRLINRILSHDAFKKEFEAFLRAILTQEMLEESLRFYDKTASLVLPEAYRDITKLETSFEVRRAIRNERDMFTQNFLTLTRMLKEKRGLSLRYAQETYPLTETLFSDLFASFAAVTASRDEFLRAYPEFTAGQDDSLIILLPGTYRFTRTVIIPQQLTLVIREGTHLQFAPNVSLISYSKIIARGDASRPITIGPLVSSLPWGVFAVVNAPQKNVFSHVALHGGKDATINGIYFSGMFSAHNADLEFRHGAIENASADDSIHVLAGEAIITDTVFRDNSSDGIDIDFAEGESLFEHNLFTATGGDSMDLSFSKIIVRDNTVETCGDKGISVGESSTPRIENNTIKGCAYGVAVKDRSEAFIANNILSNNEVGIALYRKKPHFISGGAAILIENKFIDNQQDKFVDIYSKIK